MANAIPTDLKDRNRVAIVTGQKVKMCYNGEEIEGIVRVRGYRYRKRLFCVETKEGIRYPFDLMTNPRKQIEVIENYKYKLIGKQQVSNRNKDNSIMTIETKYNIGKEVWTIGYENGTFDIVKCRIAGIEIKKHSCISIIRYKLQVIIGDNDDGLLAEYYMQDLYLEEKLYPTKEELLKSLQDENNKV